jgi:alcohol dehydrogenase class IV
MHKYACIARLLCNDIMDMSEQQAAARAIEFVRQLLKRIGTPEHLASFGVRHDYFEQIVAEALPSGSTKHNIRTLTGDDLRRILGSAL